MELMCCSADGTVAYMSFRADEIGKPMPKEEKVLLKKNRRDVLKLKLLVF